MVYCQCVVSQCTHSLPFSACLTLFRSLASPKLCVVVWSMLKPWSSMSSFIFTCFLYIYCVHICINAFVLLCEINCIHSTCVCECIIAHQFGCEPKCDHLCTHLQHFDTCLGHRQEWSTARSNPLLASQFGDN